MNSVQITVKIHNDTAIIRKVVKTPTGQVISIYGLSNKGHWIQKTEGEPYPTSCILTTLHYTDTETVA